MDESAAILEALLQASRSGSESALERYCPHVPTVKQQAFLDLDCKEALFGGAAGGGKSDALLMGALQHVDVPGYNAILFRRKFTDLALPEALMSRSHEWLGPTDAHWDGDIKTWRFPSGASIVFGYMDGPRDHERYQGSAYQYAGFDELTQFLRHQYLYLFSRTRRKKGMPVRPRVRGASNPGGVGHDWVYERFFENPINAKGERRVFVPSRIEDNPYLDADEYRESLSELDEITRRQLELGEWIKDSSGLVYKFRKTLEVDKLPDLPSGERWYHVVGIDYGNVDATAHVLIAFSRHCPNSYVIESEAWTELTPSDAGAKLQKWNTDHRPDALVADTGGLGKGYAEEARQRYSLPIEPADKRNKLGYIKLINGAMEKSRLLFLPGNEELIAELGTLPWKNEDKLAEHPDFDNHLCDALLYGWRAARHWAWTEAEMRPPPGTPEALKLAEAERLEKRKRRIARQQREGFRM